MRVTSLELLNFRSFVNLEPIRFDQINVLVGANNSGKSSILRALHLLQQDCGHMIPDIRVGNNIAQVTIGLEQIDRAEWSSFSTDSGKIKIDLQINNVDSTSSINHHYHKIDGSITRIDQFINQEPDHFIVPFLSKRKTGGYSEDVRKQFASTISNSMIYLAAKLSVLGNPGHPDHERYSKTCKEILGFIVTTIPSTSGQRAGVYLPDRQTIPIDQMGEGVPNIVALLADLALSSGKLFLIEEPENDLHPKALKALLDLIVESSEKNQFIISTHSNIVVRHLASVANSKLYNVTSETGSLPPIANICEVEPTVDARLKILSDLGYSFSDFDLWDGWLILEESSAERIIRDYLIPWFAPKLARIRTVSTGGVSQVEPTFDDFNRLIRFTHLEQIYRNAAWVLVDGDDAGVKIINRLKERYSSWNEERFSCLKKEQFEHYYPLEFSEKVAKVLSIGNKNERREAKRNLLDEVRCWLDSNEDRARKALEESSAEVIGILVAIESQLF
ncbi:MAG: ATP-dependent nuclease [Methylobacter sp.]